MLYSYKYCKNIVKKTWAFCFQLPRVGSEIESGIRASGSCDICLSGTLWDAGMLPVAARLPVMANPGPSAASAGVLVKLHACFLEKRCDQSQRPPEISDQGCRLHKSRRKVGKVGRGSATP